MFEVRKFESLPRFNLELSTVAKNVEAEWQVRKVSVSDDQTRKIGRLLVQNQHLFADSIMIASDKEACLELLSQLRQTVAGMDNSYIQRLIQLIDDSFRRLHSELPPIFQYMILSKLPTQTEKKIQKSVYTFLAYRDINPEIANIAFAKWIDENRIPIDKLKLDSISELKPVLPHLKFLNLCDLYLTTEDLEDLKLAENCPNLIHLKVSSNEITELPPLPPNLQKLWCTSQNLRKLPPLPPRLKKLWCMGNQLEQLPELPQELQVLDCSSSGKLKKLPELPDGLKALICSCCASLKQLPVLPKELQVLDCSCSRKLKELPLLPQELQMLDYSLCKLEVEPTIPEGCDENH